VLAGTSGLVAHLVPRGDADRVTLSTHLRDGGRRPFDNGSDDVAVVHQPRFLVGAASATVGADGGAAPLGSFPLPSGRTLELDATAGR
ncbi:MAG: hypothetical protein ACF8XB_22265, partial [Planctomycetota bacterium JB042]